MFESYALPETTSAPAKIAMDERAGPGEPTDALRAAAPPVTRWVGFRVGQQMVDSKVAADWNLNLAKGSASAKDFWVVYEAVLFTDFYDEHERPGGVYAVRKGVGVRIELRATDVKANVEMSFAAASLAADGGLASTQHEAYGLGITDAAFVTQLPKPGRVDRSTLDQVAKAVTAAAKWVADNQASLQPSEISTFVANKRAEDQFATGRSALLAAKCVRDGLALAEALERGATSGCDREVVRAAYSWFTDDYSENPEVGSEAKQRARKWLGT